MARMMYNGKDYSAPSFGGCNAKQETTDDDKDMAILLGEIDSAVDASSVVQKVNPSLKYNPAEHRLQIGNVSFKTITESEDYMIIHADQEIALMSDVVEVVNKNWSPSEIAAGAFTTMSSQRYKENITDMEEGEARKLLLLRPVKYDYKDRCNGQNCYGMIAEEAVKVMQYPVAYDKDGRPNALDYSKFVPYLIKMVQLQEKEIGDLKKRLEALGSK